MAIIQFSNGVKVNFDGNPTEKDIEEIAQKLTDTGVLSKENAGVRTADKPDLLQKTSKVLDTIFGGGKRKSLKQQSPKNRDSLFHPARHRYKWQVMLRGWV